MDLFKTYQDIFNSKTGFENFSLDNQIKKLKEMDLYLPATQSFFLLINSAEFSYHFVSKNFEAITGFSKKEMLSKGAEFWLSHWNPTDLKNWLEGSRQMMEFTINNIDITDRKKLIYSYNFRVNKANGTTLQILSHLSPINFDKTGKPVMGIAHYTVLESDENPSTIITIKKLNDDNRYETVFYKNFTQDKLIDQLSKRELEILKNLVEGLTSKEIGEKLFLSPHTVDGHRRNILKKLDYDSTGELIQFCKSHRFF